MTPPRPRYVMFRNTTFSCRFNGDAPQNETEDEAAIKETNKDDGELAKIDM